MKKISILPAAAAVLLLSVSCASVPKTQPPAESVPAGPSEQISQEQSADAEKQDAGTKEAYGDLSEPVASDIPEGSTPAASQPEPEAAVPSSGGFEEPVVRDEPYVEKTAASEKEAAAPTETAVPEVSEPKPSVRTQAASETKPAVQVPSAERTDAAAGADETTPVKRAADAQRISSAGGTVSQPETTADVQKRESTAVPAEPETAATSAGGGTQAAEESEKPVPSRSVTLDRNQYLDVAYPGTGWIYLGETDGTKNMTFFGRKLGETDTSFTLRARNTGRSLLHFYKNDALTGNYIDDYLEVNVADKDASTQEHVTAPSYADAVPPRPSSAVAESREADDLLKTGGTNSGAPAAADSRIQNTETQPAGTPSASAEEAPVKTVIQTTESAPESRSGSTPQNTADRTGAAPSSQAGSSGAPAVPDEQTMNESADSLLKDAQDAYNAKQYEKAQALLAVFFDKAVTRIDEGLYLQGQILEAKSSIQNIKGAIDSYEILMKNWPDSQLWQNARQRDIYLHRMYIDIR